MSQITLAASPKALAKALESLRAGFRQELSQTVTKGRLTVAYDVAFHLENGAVQLRDDGTVRINQLDIKWDRLKLQLGLDIPEIKVGDLRVFGKNPDITLFLDLSGLVRSEVSLTATPSLQYFVNPNRPAGESDHTAHELGQANEWRIFLQPSVVDLDIFDVPDMAVDLIRRAAERAIDGALGDLPDWAKAAIRELMGTPLDIFRRALDLQDDLDEWLDQLFGQTTGLENQIVEAITVFFARKHPVALEDPFPLFSADDTGLIPVLAPLRNLSVTINTQELIISADVEV